jgi:hypothetical protein
VNDNSRSFAALRMTTRRAKAKQVLRYAQDDNSKSADNADNKKMLTTLTIKMLTALTIKILTALTILTI